jgi:hypothetical protein
MGSAEPIKFNGEGIQLPELFPYPVQQSAAECSRVLSGAEKARESPAASPKAEDSPAPGCV